jgi:uncharacterized damage-inducible protein DinB
MKGAIRNLVVATTLVVAATATAKAQGGVVADLLVDLGQVEQKMMSLAKAMPADKYDWRPGAGVRSFGEVVLHVAADNYLIPAMGGVAADPATGITKDYNSAVAYEKRKLSRDAAIAEMEKSFAHLKKAMQGTAATALGEKVQMFGQSFTRQQMWILATTHLHEHLGQAIAYARSNGVKPPWSQ